jgi:hypothetical protein
MLKDGLPVELMEEDLKRSEAQVPGEFASTPSPAVLTSRMSKGMGEGNPEARIVLSSNAWVDPRIVSVTVAGIRSYLLAREWRLRPYPGPELLVFEGPPDDDGQPIVEVVPSSEQMRDFLMRIEELIGALSVIEDRPARDVLEDVLAAGMGPPAPRCETVS